jgi:hypothetical protein
MQQRKTFPSFHTATLPSSSEVKQQEKGCIRAEENVFQTDKKKVLSPPPIYSDFLSFRFIPDLLNYLNTTVMLSTQNGANSNVFSR